MRRFFLFVILIVLFLPGSVSAIPERQFNTGSTINNLNNTVIELQLSNSSGTSTSTIVYGSGNFLADFHSVNFSVDGVDIPFWIESIAGGVATVWVNISTVTSGQVVNLSWDNSVDDGSLSNAATTFNLDISNLLAAYDLNGNSIDTSGYNYNGTDTSMSYSAGIQGKSAAYFNGTSSFISMPIPNPTGYFSITGVYNSAQTASTGIMFGGDTANPYSGLIYLASSPVKMYALDHSLNVGVSSTTTGLADSHWRSFGFTVNNKDEILYLNGTSDGTKTETYGLGSWDATHFLGKWKTTGANYYAGYLQYMKVFNKTLSPTESSMLGNMSNVQYTTPNYDGHVLIYPYFEVEPTWNGWTPSYMPTSPVDCISENGSTWINISCSAGSGNITDQMAFYNVNTSGWKNGSQYYQNFTGLVTNVSYLFRAYSVNTSSTTTVNDTYTSISNTTSTANNSRTVALALPNGTRPRQINLIVSNGYSYNNETHVFCNSLCAENFTDVAFTIDNVTYLPHWIEDNTSGSIWVNLTANGTVYMKYGYVPLTTSNGTATFKSYYAFDSANVDFTNMFVNSTVQSPTYSWADFVLSIIGVTDDWSGLILQQSFGTDTAFTFSASYTGLASTYAIFTGYTSRQDLWGNNYSGFLPKTDKTMTSKDSGPNNQTSISDAHSSGIYTIKRNGTTSVLYSKDYGVDIEETLYVPIVSMYPSFWVTNYLDTGTVDVVYMYVRDYTYPDVVSESWSQSGDYVTYEPPSPEGCTSVNGTSWINVSCSAGTGNISDGMMFLNTNTSEWKNGTQYYQNFTSLTEETLYAIRIYAYNSTSDTTMNMSYAEITDSSNTLLYPNAPMNIQTTSGVNWVYLGWEADNPIHDTDGYITSPTLSSGGLGTSQISHGAWQNTPIITDGDVTYYVWAGRTTGTAKAFPWITAYNHTTNTTETAVNIDGTNGLTSDDHGSPTMIMDAAGHIHVYYGAHQSPIYHKKTTNPRDITSWTTMNSSGAGAYPMQIRTDDGTLYQFHRDTGSYDYRWVWINSTDNGTSWSSDHIYIVESTSPVNYSYGGGMVYDSINNRIYWAWSTHSGAIGDRYDIDLAYLNLSDFNMYSMDGTNLGTQISGSELDTTTIYLTGLHKTNVPVIDFDSSNNPVVLFPYQTTEGVATAYEYRIIKWNGSAWLDLGQIATTGNAFNQGDFRVNADGSISAYLTTSINTRGGDIKEYSYDGSSWSFVRSIKSDGTKYIMPTLARDGAGKVIRTNSINLFFASMYAADEYSSWVNEPFLFSDSSGAITDSFDVYLNDSFIENTVNTYHNYTSLSTNVNHGLNLKAYNSTDNTRSIWVNTSILVFEDLNKSISVYNNAWQYLMVNDTMTYQQYCTMVGCTYLSGWNVSGNKFESYKSNWQQRGSQSISNGTGILGKFSTNGTIILIMNESYSWTLVPGYNLVGIERNTTLGAINTSVNTNCEIDEIDYTDPATQNSYTFLCGNAGNASQVVRGGEAVWMNSTAEVNKIRV